MFYVIWYIYVLYCPIQVSGLKRELPANVHLLTVQLLEKTNLLLRLEHMFAANEDANLSTPVTVNIKVCMIHLCVTGHVKINHVSTNYT